MNIHRHGCVVSMHLTAITTVCNYASSYGTNGRESNISNILRVQMKHFVPAVDSPFMDQVIKYLTDKYIHNILQQFT